MPSTVVQRRKMMNDEITSKAASEIPSTTDEGGVEIGDKEEKKLTETTEPKEDTVKEEDKTEELHNEEDKVNESAKDEISKDETKTEETSKPEDKTPEENTETVKPTEVKDEAKEVKPQEGEFIIFKKLYPIIGN